MLKKVFACATACTVLTACPNRAATPVRVETQTVEVEVPVACPSKEEYDRLLGLKPVPLREQGVPDSYVEKVGKLSAQLGLYEATGAFVDQVWAAITSCQKTKPQ